MDILDQNEIDALLSAVDAGEIEVETTTGQLFTHQRRDLDHIEIRPYDFKRPERVSKEQMRALQTLHEAFARIFGASLSGFLRTIVEVKVAFAEQMTYGEFIASLPNPTAFNLIQTETLEGLMCLEVSPLIVYPIVDRLMGGSQDGMFIPQRPMTVIEQNLIGVILGRALDALSEAWAGVAELNFKATEMESNPQLVQIVPPNEVVIVIGFELKLGGTAGTMNLCIPFNVIEPVMVEINAQSWFNRAKGKDAVGYAARVSSRLTDAVLCINGLLAETSITMDDLVNLSEGDLIVTEKEAKNPVVLCVEGEKKFVAQIGQFRGKRALKVVRGFEPEDRF